MRRASNPPLLLELQRATDSASQIPILKALKNELVGHELKKREWVTYGIIPVLSRILSSKKKVNGKRAERETVAQGRSSHTHASLTDDDTAFLQVTNIVGVIAHGGPAVVQPILHGNILVNILNGLLAVDCHPKVALAILRCLNTIADRLPPSGPTQWLPDAQLATLLYSQQYIGCLTNIIGQASLSASSQQLCLLAVDLICKTCTEERQKRALSDAGVLTALSVRLASFVVAQGFVLPGTESFGQDGAISRSLPPPAPPFARLTPILQVMALLVGQSKSRAEQLLAAPAILAVLSKAHDQNSPSETKKVPWGNYYSGSVLSRPKAQNPIDALLPVVPQHPPNMAAEQSNFPPLGSIGALPKRRTSFLPPAPEIRNLLPSQDEFDESDESSVIPWLLYLVRTRSGMCRLMAAKLLTFLFNLGFAKKSRISAFCVLLVPVLVQMLDSPPNDHSNPESEDGFFLSSETRLLHQTPAVLAALIMDDRELQKAAVEAGAIKKLSQALKSTFEVSREHEASLWCPEKSMKSPDDRLGQDRVIGPKGPTQRMRSTMSYREGILKALAAIAPFNDEYRKAICDQGVLPCIIDSLKPFAANASPLTAESTSQNFSTGNPAATLLAACGATRALTRSVSALRTNLIDAGIATPILKLLVNADPEIKIAATKVVGNLAMDFSPMKETISHQSVMKTLCEQAHSANPSLRFESIWALKQLVLNAANSVKISVIQELGPNWMKQLIATDPADIPPGVVIGMSEMEFPPRAHIRSGQVSGDGTNDIVMGEETKGPNVQKLDTGSQGNHEALDREDDPNLHTVEDDTAIQEQLLDLIRNLFCGEKASEIIDYIFAEMGQRDFFDILLKRLRPRTVAGATRKDNKLIAAPAGIVTKVLYIIVHIAASLSRFRNIVASNANLMRQVLTYSNHTSREIRAQCCWIAINLTYEDDPSDRAACKHRAGDLQKVGYFNKLMTMGDDVDLDVRERTKTAIQLIGQLLT